MRGQPPAGDGGVADTGLAEILIQRSQLLLQDANPLTDYSFIMRDLEIAGRFSINCPKVLFDMWYSIAICQMRLGIGRLEKAKEALTKSDEFLSAEGCYEMGDRKSDNKLQIQS